MFLFIFYQIGLFKQYRDPLVVKRHLFHHLQWRLNYIQYKTVGSKKTVLLQVSYTAATLAVRNRGEARTSEPVVIPPTAPLAATTHSVHAAGVEEVGTLQNVSVWYKKSVIS